MKLVIVVLLTYSDVIPLSSPLYFLQANVGCSAACRCDGCQNPCGTMAGQLAWFSLFISELSIAIMATVRST